MHLDAPVLDTSSLVGVVDYEPSELVITVGSRTAVADVVKTLAEQRQMLAFEPMEGQGRATVGGLVAAQRGGPRRWTAGSVRDHLLGLRLIDGMGRDLKFGGQVIKNVAGFDVTRLQAGAWGTLGVITEVSLKVLPLPQVEETLQFEFDEGDAIHHLNAWAGSPHPFSGSCWTQGVLRVRLSGVAPAVRASMSKLGGQTLRTSDAAHFWQALREREHPFFEGAGTLWRIALPPTTPPLGIPGATMIEWGGGQRWLRTALPAEVVRATVQKLGGHALLVAGGEPGVPRFHPLNPALKTLNQRLKAEFDPHHILNPGLVDFF
jgi:glycolate oxidase FAD binding subunit